MTTALQIVTQLHKTRRSIAAHIYRGEGLGLRAGERPNRLGIELADRYNDLASTLRSMSPSREPAETWVGYCAHYGSSIAHNGYDLFA